MPGIIESLNEAMLRDPRWRPHQDRRAGGTKYISTFVNSRGDVIALDLGSGGKSAIWALARLSPGSLMPSVDREFYPADRPRNSNLSVPELKGKPLTRFYPTSRSEAQQLVDHFASA
ncbi:hypothetical protein SAMN06295905_3204 [Devosia lucknowensis]|uniref:Uncharacterized protein n=1 Tax=Devosia lucknowensis TaxID=1096929 RepID=A0A1Y6GCV9_9HYPH|nr:hypothetical protein [Devosia lucknowensis]SMQ85909.1 hypothetical protein SAMN06295905_3204 [Devosia lucknowensis]